MGPLLAAAADAVLAFLAAQPTPASVDDETIDVIAERVRHASLGYDEQHDDTHGAYRLARTAQGYVLRGLTRGNRSDFIKAASVLLDAAASFRRLGHPLGTNPAAAPTAPTARAGEAAALGTLPEGQEACPCESCGHYRSVNDLSRRAMHLWPIRDGYLDDKYRTDVHEAERTAYLRGVGDALAAARAGGGGVTVTAEKVRDHIDAYEELAGQCVSVEHLTALGIEVRR